MSEDSRNASQKLYDAMYRKKIEKRVVPNGTNFVPRQILREAKSNRRPKIHRQWLPKHIVKDPAVEDALAEIAEQRRQEITAFKYY